MTPQDIIQRYVDLKYPIVAWPQVGDAKGPHEKDWPNHESPARQVREYKKDYRYGLLLGAEVGVGEYLMDVDIDWAPGALLAQAFVPITDFIFGHGAKRISHCFYLSDEPIVTIVFKDVDGTTLIELRGTKKDGTLGLQTMVPPSIWTKNGVIEPLIFVKHEGPVRISAAELKQRVTYAAITMLLAKHFGMHGFGHPTRLAWAGFLLRLGMSVNDLQIMGEAISRYCDNREVHDVAGSINSTVKGLADPKKKTAGGPTLIKFLGPHGKAVVKLIQEWLGHYQDFIRHEGKIVAKSQENIRRAVDMLGYELSYDQFADRLLINNKAMEDHQVEHIYFQIDSDYHFTPPWELFKQKLRHIAWLNDFHPVKDYLSALVWDGVPRLDTWLIDCAKVEDSAYARAVSSIMLIAAVRRIYHPGTKYDEMVVWESGMQGTEKSSACRALCPRAEWFSDDLPLNVRSQQLIEATLGKWIVEASDLAGKRKTEIEQLKAMLSRQVDGPARMAYAHFPVERPRQFILIGTTNSSSYLTDPTGARRFWPLKVSRFDIKWIVGNRDQLWAEAVVREGKGEKVRLPEELWPDATVQQEARREMDPWEQMIRMTLQGIEPRGDGRRQVTAETIWLSVNVPIERRDRSASLRISDIMQRLGFKRTRVRVKDAGVEVGFVQENRDSLEEYTSELEEIANDGGNTDVPF